MFQDLQVDEISPWARCLPQVDLRDQMANVKGQVHRGDTTPLKSEVQELRSALPVYSTYHDSGIGSDRVF